jgi:hypothetical protein
VPCLLRKGLLVAACCAVVASCGGNTHAPGEATHPPAPTPEPTVARPELSKTDKLVSIALQTSIYERPDKTAKKLGYLRLGSFVPRSSTPVAGKGCAGAWYAIPMGGYVCTTNALTTKPSSPSHQKARWDHEATLDLDHPLVRALRHPPDLGKPMPYPYAFVRAVAPLYHQLPTAAEQEKAEFKLAPHLAVYRKHLDTWNEVAHGGANAVPLDANGVATTSPDAPYPPAPTGLDEHELFGGGPSDAVPWWLHLTHVDGMTPRFDRDIPNVSTFAAPDYAIFGGRIARHAGVAIIGSFLSVDPEAKKKAPATTRRFAITVDGRLVPTDKLKPHVASAFHGVKVDEKTKLPFAFVKKQGAWAYEESNVGYRWPKHEEVTFRSIIPLTGELRRYTKARYLETVDHRWLSVDDVAYVDVPGKDDWPKEFDYKNTKWIDVSIWQQTLVAYEGDKPVYATMVSTGIDGMGDPLKTKSTIRGAFRIDAKHVTTTMDADDQAGGNKFELRDVPWVQYFERGYALHATYWHDDFGKPRSHGCINLAPIDAHWLFFWTDPQLPPEWHGVRAAVGDLPPGTWVRIRG